MMVFSDPDFSIGVIGLGYVGLPLALAFGSKYKTVGYDIDEARVAELQRQFDRTLEVESKDWREASKTSFESDITRLQNCSVFIITVPTPVNPDNTPDLLAVKLASRAVGSVMKANSVIIYESTVYPGCTREICVPILESVSGMKLNDSFFVGYSPERINPGDKTRGIRDITKLVSASTVDSAEFVKNLYSSIIDAGVHQCSSIEIAEAAKVIENAQRDINIAFVNELAMLLGKVDIPIFDVLRAASTKWNFLQFEPGLVGGHCIGVDPYYLAHMAISNGFEPDLILAGRKINDSMHEYIGHKVLECLNLERNKNIDIDSRVIIFGATFKENCPDIRNSKSLALADFLIASGINVSIHDPIVSENELLSLDYEIFNGETSFTVGSENRLVILAVKHQYYLERGADYFKRVANSNHMIFDVKNLFPSEKEFWRY